MFPVVFGHTHSCRNVYSCNIWSILKLKNVTFTVLKYYYSMYTREGFAFFPLPSTKIAPSLSHSPLPVLSIFELHGAIRHNGAV